MMTNTLNTCCFSFLWLNLIFWDMMGCGIAHSCAASPNPWGQDFRPNFVGLGGFQTPLIKMSYTTPHHIPKYEILQKKKKWRTIPLTAAVCPFIISFVRHLEVPVERGMPDLFLALVPLLPA